MRRVADAVSGLVEDGDVVTVSEKAVSTALGNILDESLIQPGRTARFLAKYWMRLIWGYFLSRLCRLRDRTAGFLRSYPIKEGSVHKQVALQHASFLQALMFGSEGGIDGSNLPYAYVCLPLQNPKQIAHAIRAYIKAKLGKNVAVMIVDTDKTYSLRNFHFTPRPTCIKGIHSFGGILTYVAGRFLKLKRRATPVATAGFKKLDAEQALEIAKIANRKRGVGAGRTVWDMAEKFGAALTGVTWEMLNKVKHKPIVILKTRKA